ncbi:MAG: porin family protein [Niabella sp.]
MKQLAIAILCMTLITAVQAQDFNFGVTAGPNLGTAKMKGDGVEQPKSVIGFQIGAFAEFGLTDKISLRPELQYTTLGYKFVPEEDLYGIRLKSSYITIPILAEYAITEKLKVGLGPYVATKLVTKYKLIPYSEEDAEIEDEGYFDYSDADNDEFKSLDYGISTGVSYLILPKLCASLRYSHGLANIFTVEGTDGSKAYNRSFMLGISYTIPLNKGKK